MSVPIVLDLRAMESIRLTRGISHHSLDTVVVKLRTTARSIKRLSAAAGLETSPAGAWQPILTSLLERGYLSEVIPVFPEPQPFAEGRGPARAGFSCTGPHITLVAPGVNILSTVPRYPSELAQSQDYDSWAGTSAATPHVAAAAALLLSKSPGLSPVDVRKRLMETADLVPGQTRRNAEYGAGRLNIASALA